MTSLFIPQAKVTDVVQKIPSDKVTGGSVQRQQSVLVSVCRGEEGAELKDKVLDLLVNLQS